MKLSYLAFVFLILFVSCEKSKNEIMSKRLNEVLNSNIAKNNYYSCLIIKNNDTILNKNFVPISNNEISCFKQKNNTLNRKTKNCNHKIYTKSINKEDINIKVCSQNNVPYVEKEKNYIIELLCNEITMISIRKNQEIQRFGE